MAKGNAYLNKLAERDKEMLHACSNIFKQYMFDCIAITLNESFGFGADRLKEVNERLTETCDTYQQALMVDTESDYYRSKLDEKLKQILNGKMEFYPFEERYPNMRRIDALGKRRS